MPITVERLPNQPIFLVYYTGMVTAEDITGMFEASARLIAPQETIIYRINILQDGSSTLADILNSIRQTAQDMPGAVTDPRFFGLFVGFNPLVDVYKDLAQRNLGARNIPVFSTLAEAIQYVEARIAAGQ